MPSKPADANSEIVEILQHLLKHMDQRFDQVDGKFADILNRCDRIEFLVSGQERRISILEDRMRVVATKLGLEFRQNA